MHKHFLNSQNICSNLGLTSLTCIAKWRKIAVELILFFNFL